MKLLPRIIFSSVTALFLLSCFGLVYKRTGTHFMPEHRATDYRWPSNQWTSTMQEGFAWFFMDSNGYNNDVEYQQDNDILIMGSSHMEAVQMQPSQNVASLLRMMTGRPVYNIGVSSHILTHCVNNMRSALKKFPTKKYVIFETYIVRPSEIDMKAVIDGTLCPRRSFDKNLFVKYMDYIPAFKLVFNQASAWIKLSLKKFSKKAEKHSIPNDQYDSHLRLFMKYVRNCADEYAVTPIIVYHPGEKIKADGSISYDVDNESLKLFSNACEMENIVFVDMTQAFENMYYQEHKLAHGFINTAVGRGHLNVDGHRVIAEQLTLVINKLEENKNGI